MTNECKKFGEIIPAKIADELDHTRLLTLIRSVNTELPNASAQKRARGLKGHPAAIVRRRDAVLCIASPSSPSTNATTLGKAAMQKHLPDPPEGLLPSGRTASLSGGGTASKSGQQSGHLPVSIGVTQAMLVQANG